MSTTNTTTELLDRIPPSNLDAERSVIGSVLLDPECLDDVLGIVRDPSEFYAYAHQVIFRQLLAMQHAGQAIDVTLLTERLTAQGVLDSIGGLDYLAEIINSVPTAANATHYASIVHDKATRRAVNHAAAELLRDAADAGLSTSELLTIAQTKLDAVSDATAGTEAATLGTCLDETMAVIEQRMSGEVDTGLPTGLDDLDAMVVGLRPERLMIVAGRPGSGKSVLGLQIAAHAAIDHGKPMLFVSLEMSRLEVTERLLASRTEIDAERIATGRIDNDERRLLAQAWNELSPRPLFIDDEPRRSVAEIVAQARRIRRRHGLAMVVIDYLQLIEPDNAREQRHEQVGRMARRLKTMARELQIPVICLAQLNREVDRTGSGRPKLSHLRESGSIEQDADVVILVHREEQNRPDDPDVIGQAELIVAKQRNGRTGTVRTAWQGETYRFLPLAKVSEWSPEGYSTRY